jgi:phosphonate transport system substrate-binding protein
MELPPSLGREPVRARARELAALLYDAGFAMVATADSYTQLEERLLSGEADAAWGPPMVCARVEQRGGRVVLRALRDGAPSYRAVLVARAQDRLDLTDPARNKRRPRAVWVDPESMAGYLLPRAFLKSVGFDLGELFMGESFLGSFQACLEAVLLGDADLTATFAPAASAPTASDGYTQLVGPRAIDLKAVAYTGECPNDGVVLSPSLPTTTADAILMALQRLLARDDTRALLAEAFAVTGFEEPPPGSYLPLLELFGETRS